MCPWWTGVITAAVSHYITAQGAMILYKAQLYKEVRCALRLTSFTILITHFHGCVCSV